MHKSLAVRAAPGAAASRRSTATALSDVQLVISGCNGLALALGRFVFLPSIREKTGMQGPGVQNGESHFAAGDARAPGQRSSSFFQDAEDRSGGAYRGFTWAPLPLTTRSRSRTRVLVFPHLSGT